MKNKIIGFIGQGWIGSYYADEMEQRGFEVIRYSLEESYIQNKEKIKECDIVFIAVPTPSTPQGFDYSIVKDAVSLVGCGKIAVIKSTILPETTEIIQREYPDVFVFHSPEFLREANVVFDVANPSRNIIGVPVLDEENMRRAKDVVDVLPKASFEQICHSKEAELIKYAGNNFLYLKVVYMNLLYDFAQKLGLNWKVVRDAVSADPRIGSSHTEPVHKSGHHEAKIGRGAGGHCFVKDMVAFSNKYKELLPDDKHAHLFFDALQNKNMHLLLSTEKDIDLLESVYGKEFLDGLR
jgi:UDPglucose 6-dehydrogenase